MQEPTRSSSPNLSYLSTKFNDFYRNVEIDISRKGQRRRYWHMCAAGIPRSAACV